MTTTPQDDELQDIYNRCDVSNNRTDNPLSFEEFKQLITAQREQDRLEARVAFAQELKNSAAMCSSAAAKLNTLEVNIECVLQRLKAGGQS